MARIGHYGVADGSFHWYGYRLEQTTADGDWMGLSEITAIDNHTFAIIERDKLIGPAARIRRVCTVTVPTAAGQVTDPGVQLPTLNKNLALDVLPALRATNGWTQEKLEGFAIAGGRSTPSPTTSLNDATGETQFVRSARHRARSADHAGWHSMPLRDVDPLARLSSGGALFDRLPVVLAVLVVLPEVVP